AGCVLRPLAVPLARSLARLIARGHASVHAGSLCAAHVVSFANCMWGAPHASMRRLLAVCASACAGVPQCASGRAALARTSRRTLASKGHVSLAWSNRPRAWTKGTLMAPVRVVVGNQKGGSGKTTTTANLAATLVEAGYRTLAVDLDPQAQLAVMLQAQMTY